MPRDREEALRRYVANTTEDVAAAAGRARSESRRAPESRGSLRPRRGTSCGDAIREAHRLVSRLTNLASVAALRKSDDSGGARADRHERARRAGRRAPRRARARARRDDRARGARRGPSRSRRIPALIEQAITNVVGNAVLYNNPGGRVQIELKGYERDSRFSLRVTDNGPGVSDEEFAGLTANRRFRGDEGRTRRPGGRGLGLAIAREVTDRFGLKLDLRRPSSRGI